MPVYSEYEQALRDALKAIEFGPAHTYASENADLYRGFDNGVEACKARIENLLNLRHSQQRAKAK